MRQSLTLGLAALALALAAPAVAQERGRERGNVIFFHPDGAGAGHWAALRLLQAGPDGEIAWDRLPAMATYTGHMKDRLTATSHGGATTHAYGVKVAADSFGLDGDRPIVAASGRPMSIAEEAMEAGLAVGLVQTGHIAEPGTAAFVASTESRRDTAEIARQVIESGAQVILAGGERFLLPEGVAGRHGAGARRDGIDLIARARALGYTIVYDREELLALDTAAVHKLLGVFAHSHTFNDDTEAQNRAAGLGAYAQRAPTIAEMSRVALEILSRDPDGFYLVAEEEGTDNLGNNNNAPGQMQALARADEAIGVFHAFVEANPRTLLITTADSDAGGLRPVGGTPAEMPLDVPVLERDLNGAPRDGAEGGASPPFVAAPDRAGARLPFLVAWAGVDDLGGGVLVRGAGLNADMIRGVVDNTEIYAITYETLFGVAPGERAGD